MGAIWGFVKIIYGMVSAVVTVVRVIGAQIVTGIIDTLTFVINIATVTIQAIVETTIDAVTMDFEGIKENLIEYWDTLNELSADFFTEMIKTVDAIKINFKYLLTVIQFKYLRTIHTIGLIVSEDYRAQVGKFWNSVADLSGALGEASNALPTLLRITQSSQQTFAAMAGQNYEISHLKWMKTMSDWDGWTTLKAERHSMSFGKMCNIIDGAFGETFYRMGMSQEQIDVLYGPGGPFYGDEPRLPGKMVGFEPGLNPQIFNGMSNLSTILIGQTDALLNISDTTSAKIFKIDKKIDEGLESLGFGIGDKIAEVISPVKDKIKTFIADEYQPAIDKLAYITEKHKRDLQAIEDEMLLVGNKLKKPGDLLSSVDHLSDLDRIDQEYKIAEVAGRPIARECDAINSGIAVEAAQTEERWGKLTADTPEPSYVVEEAEGLVTKPGVEPKPGQSWFVGDF